MFCSTIIEYAECYTHKGWKYMNISRPFSIIYYVLGGTAWYEINKKPTQFKKNHLYILPANTRYSLYEDPKDKLYHTYIHAFLYPELKHVIEVEVEKDAFLKSIMELIRKYANDKQNIYIRKMTELLISYISERESSDRSALSLQIKNYIDANFIDIFKDNNLSEIFSYSNAQITRIFKRAYNTTPHKYCRDLVLKYILDLLKENHSASEISDMLNFSSLANFSRFFKNGYGFSPSVYSKMLKNNNNQ